MMDIFISGKCKKTVVLVLASALISVVLSLAVVGIVFFIPDVISIFDKDLGAIFLAWKDADVDINWLFTMLCGAICCLVQYALWKIKKNRVLTAVLSVISGIILTAASLFVVLWTSSINSVPFSVFVKVAIKLTAHL